MFVVSNLFFFNPNQNGLSLTPYYGYVGYSKIGYYRRSVSRAINGGYSGCHCLPTVYVCGRQRVHFFLFFFWFVFEDRILFFGDVGRTSGFLLLVLQRERKKLGCSTRNRKFKRLEPHFQTSETRSAPKEDTKNAVALARSRECTKELISGLPNFGSMESLGARAEKRKVLRKKNGGRRASIVFVVGTFLCFVVSATQVLTV